MTYLSLECSVWDKYCSDSISTYPPLELSVKGEENQGLSSWPTTRG